MALKEAELSLFQESQTKNLKTNDLFAFPFQAQGKKKKVILNQAKSVLPQLRVPTKQPGSTVLLIPATWVINWAVFKNP